MNRRDAIKAAIGAVAGAALPAVAPPAPSDGGFILPHQFAKQITSGTVQSFAVSVCRIDVDTTAMLEGLKKARRQLKTFARWRAKVA